MTSDRPPAADEDRAPMAVAWICRAVPATAKAAFAAITRGISP